MEPTTQAEPTVCVICHGPNPTTDRTCSDECDIELAYQLGHIHDYPEEDTRMNTVIYEPKHDADTMDTITKHLAAHGYNLDPDGSYYLPYVAAVEMHDRLMVCTTRDETSIDGINEHDTVADYAAALADALNGLVKS